MPDSRLEHTAIKIVPSHANPALHVLRQDAALIAFPANLRATPDVVAD